MRARRPGRGGDGQDEGLLSLELVALLPLLAAAMMLVLQVGLVFSGILAAGGATRAAARADQQGADPLAAARSSMPDWLETGMVVSSPEPGHTRLRVTVPSVVPVLDPFVVNRDVFMDPES